MGTMHDVRYFDADMAGAPSTAGMAAPELMIALLDACLVTGFNLRSVLRIVVADGVATVNIVIKYHGKVLLAAFGIAGQHFLVQSLVAHDAIEQLHSQ